jgi:D-alanyl-D-alanine carboxypeptidase
VQEQPPTKIAPADDEALMAANSADEALPEVEGGAAKTIRLQLAVKTSLRPQARPEYGEAAEEVVASMQDSIAGALAEAAGAPPPADSLEGQAVALSVTAAPAVTSNVALVAMAPRPEKRAAPIYDTTAELAVAEAEQVAASEVVTLSTSGGRHYGVMIGQFNSHNEADRFLTKTVLAEGPTLGHGLRKVVHGNQGFTGNVLGLTQREADLACARLQSKGVQCFTMGAPEEVLNGG